MVKLFTSAAVVGLIASVALMGGVNGPTPAQSDTPPVIEPVNKTKITGTWSVTPKWSGGKVVSVDVKVTGTNAGAMEATPMCGVKVSGNVMHAYGDVKKDFVNHDGNAAGVIPSPNGAGFDSIQLTLRTADGSTKTEVIRWEGSKCEAGKYPKGTIDYFKLSSDKSWLSVSLLKGKGKRTVVSLKDSEAESIVLEVWDCSGKKYTKTATRIKGTGQLKPGSYFIAHVSHPSFKKARATVSKQGYDSYVLNSTKSYCG